MYRRPIRPGKDARRMETPVTFEDNSGMERSALFILPTGRLAVPVAILCRDDAVARADDQNRQIADHLQSEGIASLLLDLTLRGALDRPTPESLAEPVGDIGRAMDALQRQAHVDAGKIGIYGTGLAGTAGLLRAANEPRIHALVLRSTPAPASIPRFPIDVPTLIV